MPLDLGLASSWMQADATSPARGVHTLHSNIVVPASLDRTFEFFADAANLERLTPPWLSFKIKTPLPIAMAEGTIIDYLIELYGVPIPWRTRIDTWESGVRFVDRQVSGPYRWWRHEHRFEAVPNGTRVTDQVDYVPRAAFFSSALVTRDVNRIFAYRQQTLEGLLT